MNNVSCIDKRVWRRRASGGGRAAGRRQRGPRWTGWTTPERSVAHDHGAAPGDEARAEFARAADLTRNERERRVLRDRAGLSKQDDTPAIPAPNPAFPRCGPRP